MSNNIMKTTILDIYNFYKKYPEFIGKINVETRFGFKKILACEITARNSEVIKIKTLCNKTIKVSPDHLLLSNNLKWTKTKDLNKGDFLFTKDGPTYIKDTKLLKGKQDLYDIQVEEVSEYYANEIVSHNSLLLETISFVLFNKPFRDINKGQLLNSITNKNLVVEIEFEQNGKQYRVARGIKPNLFDIYLNDQKIAPPANIADHQSMLEEQILKTNHKTFCQVVMLGSAIFVPFMQLKTAQRREVIEDLLDLKVFSIMNILLKEKVKTIDNDIKQREHDIQLDEQRIILHNKYLEQINTNNDKTIQEINDKISIKQKIVEQLEIDHDQFEQQIILLNSGLSDISKSKNRINKLLSLQGELNSEIKSDCNSIKFFNDNDVCSVCTQPIESEFKNNIIKKATDHKEQCNQAILKISDQLRDLNEQLTDHEQQQKQIAKISNKKIEVYHSIKNEKRMIEDLQQDIINLQKTSKKTSTEIDIKKSEKHLNKLNCELISLKKEKRTCSFALIMLKDNGIKAKVISQYIPTINQLINKYLTDLDFFVDFNLNENFEETIRSRFRDEFTYNSFSEGQKARIDLSLMFAWREISRIRNSFNCNLLILDEIFDGALDVEGIENLSKILGWFDDNSNIFVISHKEGFGDQFDRTINVYMENGFTKMENI